MRVNGIELFLIVSSMAGATAMAQVRSSIPPPTEQTERRARLQLENTTRTEAEVEALLQEVAQLVQRVRQSAPPERISQYRELERLFAKLQQTQQPNPAAAGAANPADQAVILRQAAQVLEQAAQGVRGGGTGQRAAGNAAAATGGTLGSTRLYVRQNLGGGLNVQVGGGAWWTDSDLTGRLGLTEDQKSRIDRAFLNHRTNLEASRDNLQREETQLSRLLDSDPLDRNAITVQINRVTSARGEVERENATMTLEMREQMTRAQWDQLQVLSPRATVTVDVPISYITRDAISPAGGAVIRGAGGRGARGQQ